MFRCNGTSLLSFGAAVIVATAFGCGRSGDGLPRVAVKGRVQVDGRPLSQGVIRFLPDQSVAGRNVEAVVKNGEYALDRTAGPVPGKHRVEIEAAGHLGFDLDDEAAYARQIQTHGGLPANPIPPQFNRNSQLTVDIPAGGKEDLNFDLKLK
jgi:hypothetical protein